LCPERPERRALEAIAMTPPEHVTLVVCRPRFEGANIRTWVGFKHFLYLVEEAVLQWFRQRDAGPQRLYHRYGMGLEIIDSSAQLPAVLEADDEVLAEVAAKRPGHFEVKLRVDRSGRGIVALKGKIRVALIRERQVPEPPYLPTELRGLVAADVRATTLPVEPGETGGGTIDLGAFSWTWKVRYFHCHYSARVQHSAYVRALEEVVDRFLADRGISVGRLLAERSWIPVVSRVRVQMLADAFLDETILTTFVVEEVFKRAAFDGRMDCYVHRGERLVRTATARILHGYAVSDGPDAGRLAELDDVLLADLWSQT